MKGLIATAAFTAFAMAGIFIWMRASYRPEPSWGAHPDRAFRLVIPIFTRTGVALVAVAVFRY